MTKDKEKLEKQVRLWLIVAYSLYGIGGICLLIAILSCKALFVLLMLAIVVLIAAFSGDDISRTRP